MLSFFFSVFLIVTGGRCTLHNAAILVCKVYYKVVKLENC